MPTIQTTTVIIFVLMLIGCQRKQAIPLSQSEQFVAARDGNLHYFLNAPAVDYHLTSEEGYTVTTVAALRGHLELLQYFTNFVDMNKELNLKNPHSFNSTGFYDCVISGNIEVIKFCLEYNVDINDTDITNSTPLHWAFKHGYKDIAKLLLEHGADPNIRNIGGHTPLDMAIRHGYPEMGELLNP